MTKEEILHLSTLSRLRLTPEEADKMNPEIDAILEYVGTVNQLVDDGHLSKEVGAVHNVFRVDETANPTDSRADDLIAAFPEREGNYLKVKKILNPDV